MAAKIGWTITTRALLEDTFIARQFDDNHGRVFILLFP